MTTPIKLDITDTGDVVIHDEYRKASAIETQAEEKALYEKDPENYVYECFHGKKCKHVQIIKDPTPSMICKKTGKGITLEVGCPFGLWEYKQEKRKKEKKEDWYKRNRRLHYEDIAEKWEKYYGSTRKLPDYIVKRMQLSK